MLITNVLRGHPNPKYTLLSSTWINIKNNEHSSQLFLKPSIKIPSISEENIYDFLEDKAKSSPKSASARTPLYVNDRPSKGHVTFSRPLAMMIVQAVYK